jgi:predicted RNA-binding protein (virulence factor B family)
MLVATDVDDAGVWFDEVRLPAREAEGIEVGQELRLFVYDLDGDVPIATRTEPLAVAGQFALLRCVDLSDHGAFLDWGLTKDLFVPWSLQHREMEVGLSYVVYLREDPKTRRPVGTSKLGKHLDYEPNLDVGAEVALLVFGFNDLGAQVIVDGRYPGIVYASRDMARPHVGDTLPGWVQRVRPDGRIDVSPKPLGRKAAWDAKVVVVAALMAEGGYLPLHDRSDPEAIRGRLGLSKKAFKRAVGELYRARRIALEDEGIRLLSKG